MAAKAGAAGWKLVRHQGELTRRQVLAYEHAILQPHGMLSWHDNPWRCNGETEARIVAVRTDKKDGFESHRPGIFEAGKHQRPTNPAPRQRRINRDWPQQ